MSTPRGEHECEICGAQATHKYVSLGESEPVDGFRRMTVDGEGYRCDAHSHPKHIPSGAVASRLKAIPPRDIEARP